MIRHTARYLHEGHMRRLGIANTMRLAHACSRLQFGRYDRYRCELYRTQFDALLEENGAPTTPRIQMKDGYAIDTSMSLPHLDELLKDSAAIIKERGGVRRSAQGAYRSFFQNLYQDGDLEKYPSLLNFAASSDVLAVVADYLGCVPVMSSTLPVGIRFVESSAEYDDAPETPKDSQLFHMDYYSRPNVYIIVLLEDVTPEKGPFCFLPKARSKEAAAQLKNWSRGHDYRFTDEEFYAVVDPSELIEFSYPRGTVLFIESNGCFHMGSRNCVQPRYQLMYGYTPACRTDLSELFMTPKLYPSHDSDSRLRKLLLRKNYVAN